MFIWNRLFNSYIETKCCLLAS